MVLKTLNDNRTFRLMAVKHLILVFLRRGFSLHFGFSNYFVSFPVDLMQGQNSWLDV
jgi:hypothetical protein